MKTMTIKFKDGRTLPGIPYTQANIDQYEKVMGQEIKEFSLDEEKKIITVSIKEEETPGKITSANQVPKKIKDEIIEEYVKKNPPKSPVVSETVITDEVLIKEFTKRGKEPLSIAKYLGITKEKVLEVLKS